MPDKQEVLNYFDQCAKQAEFDGDGNAAAMFVGLKNDVITVEPARAFVLRPTFLDGTEERQRAEALKVEEETIAPLDAVDAAAPVSVESAEVSEPANTEQPAAGDTTGSPAVDAALSIPPQPAAPLTDAAHEASQDAKIKKLEEELAAAKAKADGTSAIAEKFAPQS